MDRVVGRQVLDSPGYRYLTCDGNALAVGEPLPDGSMDPIWRTPNCRAAAYCRAETGLLVGAADPELDMYLHLFLINRGVLMKPFHNMALVSQVTEDWMIDRHSDVLASATDFLRRSSPTGLRLFAFLLAPVEYLVMGGTLVKLEQD
jgi:hypothetical protein